MSFFTTNCGFPFNFRELSNSTTAVRYLLTTPSMSMHNSYDPVICSGLTKDDLTTHVVDPVSLNTIVSVLLTLPQGAPTCQLNFPVTTGFITVMLTIVIMCWRMCCEMLHCRNSLSSSRSVRSVHCMHFVCAPPDYIENRLHGLYSRVQPLAFGTHL